jgi:hypothetical protein
LGLNKKTNEITLNLFINAICVKSMNILLNNQVSTYLVNDMSIDIESIYDHLKSKELIPYTPLLLKTVEEFVEYIIKYSNDSALDSIYTNAMKEIENKAVDTFLCTMLQSCRSFLIGGLRDLYIYQHNEDWCPKLIIKNVITPNDIEFLPDIVSIYRGCNINELNNQNYGQAWTTSIEIAKEFAYKHYFSQSWFVLEDRVILESCILKLDILFSCQSNYERDIVVNTKKLLNICIFT